MTWRRGVLAAIFIACELVTGPLLAGDISPKTVTTHLKLDDCEQSGNVEDGGIWICAGYDGMRVYLAEGDLRTFVSFGPRAEDEPAAQQTLPVFNSLFEPEGQEADILWRVEDAGGKQTPFAAITHHHTESDSVDGVTRKGEVLVITRLGPGGNSGVCQVGYIDILANADALALAERIADAEAKSFDCTASEPKVYGSTGKSPMLADGD